MGIPGLTVRLLPEQQACVNRGVLTEDSVTPPTGGHTLASFRATWVSAGVGRETERTE